MKLPGPINQYLAGEKPSHTSRARLSQHIPFCPQAQVEPLLTKGGYLQDGKIAKKALTEGLVDLCEDKPLWNLKATKLALLALMRKPTTNTAPRVITPPRAVHVGPVWTDLENIGTYFGVSKNKIGTWLEALGLRGYKPMQINESGDIDMLDMANASKEKFRTKVPTQKALDSGYAQMEVIEYKAKGSDKSFEKYTWDRDRVKDLLIKAGHELDTERKLLLKGKGKNSNVTVASLDGKVEELYAQWRRQYLDPATSKASWRLFERQSTGVIKRIEMKLGYPRFIQDRLYQREENLKKIKP